MDASNLDVASQLVPFVQGGRVGIRQFEKRVGTLLSSRRLPEEGWSDADIEQLLLQFASMDSNHFAVGVGEREGRVVSSLVQRRSYGLSHGMGRSGNLAGAQPKAAGSSLLVSLTNLFALQTLQAAGDAQLTDAVVVPVATGMALTLCLTALRRERPTAKFVVWCRCDQQSAIKAVSLCGLELVVVHGVLRDHAVVTDMAAVTSTVARLGPENVCCVLSTTSCFAPRVPDDIEAIARLCKASGVPHLINNAYGVQSALIMRLIARATRVGRVDGYVQSTDKNWCVPVGGAVIAGRVSSLATAEYAGRASSQPVIDLFITCLSLGLNGWKKLLADREELFRTTYERLERDSEAMGFVMLKTAANPISIALGFSLSDPKMLGSMLFTRGLTGHRVCSRTTKLSTPDGSAVSFQNWGQHIDVYTPSESYLTVAVAIGANKEDIDTALTIIRKTMAECKKKAKKKEKKKEEGDAGGKDEAKAVEEEKH